jgi:hypothetical protein
MYLPLITLPTFLPHSSISQFLKMRSLFGPAFVILLASLQAYAWTECYMLSSVKLVTKLQTSVTTVYQYKYYVCGQYPSMDNIPEDSICTVSLVTPPAGCFSFCLTLRRSSEISVCFYQTKRRHIHEDNTFNSDVCESLKTNIIVVV